MLYAIGAGSQVKAVDKYSDYPTNAPHDPRRATAQRRGHRLVPARPRRGVRRQQRPDGQLAAFGIPVLSFPPAATLNDAYAQFAQLGRGHRASGPGGRPRSPTEVADRRRSCAPRPTPHASADLLLRARPDLLLGDVVDVHRQGARPPRAEATSPTRPRGARRAGATRSCRPSSSCRPTPTTSSWPTPSAAGRTRAPWPPAGMVDDQGGAEAARSWAQRRHRLPVGAAHRGPAPTVEPPR